MWQNTSAIVKAPYSEKIQGLDGVDLSVRFKNLPLLMRQIEVSEAGVVISLKLRIKAEEKLRRNYW